MHLIDGTNLPTPFALTHRYRCPGRAFCDIVKENRRIPSRTEAVVAEAEIGVADAAVWMPVDRREMDVGHSVTVDPDLDETLFRRRKNNVLNQRVPVARAHARAINVQSAGPAPRR